MKQITIIGGGIAGLSAAYFLSQRVAPERITLHEAGDRLGGLLNTVCTPWGLAEEAARAVINHPDWEALCDGVGAALLPADRASRRRYIYRGKPRQMPLTPTELLRTAFGGVVPFVLNRSALKPKPEQTVGDWGRQHLGRGAAHYLVAPALSGIYAGEIDRLSATLILGKFFDRGPKPAKTRIKERTVTPQGGFVDLIAKLETHLRERGVAIQLNSVPNLTPEDLNHPVIVATSAQQAANVLRPVAPAAAESLAGTEMLSLTVVCAWFDPAPGDLQGFGCLFAPDQGFRSLGVIFNDMLFPRGETHRSETWILGGERSPESVGMSDDDLIALVARERARLRGVATPTHPVGFHIKRWSQALPYYTPALERVVTGLSLPANLHLTGNYLGGIGLSKIVEQSKAVAERISE